MAFQMNFLDKFGHQLETSYWRLSSFTFDRISRSATFHFHCWVNKATHDEGRAPVDIRTVVALNADFDSIASILTSGFGSQVYTFAKSHKDIPTGQVDENGTPVFVSFFESATDVV